jgi:Flp pilus assembly protein TadD
MFLRNCLFSIFVVTVFFTGSELILAMAGVRPVVSVEDPFVGFSEHIPLFVEGTSADGRTVLRTADNKLALFNYQSFPARKGDNSYRVFCVGGSTTFGRPYDDPVSFCGWLRAYLQAADPSRDWEIINAGGVSYASYRVARVMEEVAQYQPDLFIVYSGQNEFLEHRSYGDLADLPAWVINLNARLSGTRIYTAMSQALAALKPDSLEQARERYRLSGEVDAVLDHTIGPQSYHRDDVLKDRIMAHYRHNLDRMVMIAEQAGARIIFVKPAINIRDMSPFKSEHRADMSGQQLDSWQALYQRAASLEQSGNSGEALAVYRQGLALDDRHAELHYRIGRILFDRGEHDAAERSLRRAIEEDIAPLRILEPMQRDLEQAAGAAGVPLVDFPAVLRADSLERYGHAVFGNEYFVDHVHTSVDGYRMLGLALFEELVRQGVARPDAAWNEARRESVRQAVIGKLDAADEGHALAKLARVFSWAGKFPEAYNLFRQALEVLGPRPELYDQLARTAFITGDTQSAIRHLQEQLEKFPASPGVHARLAALQGDLGNTEVAIRHCQLELLLNPADQKVMAMLGDLYARQGDDAAARTQYENALRLDPAQERARLGLALLLIRQGQHEQALPHARGVLQAHPEQYLAHNALGLIFMRQGEIDRAAQHFLEVLRLQPGNEEAMGNLRQLQAEHADTELAGHVRQQACRIQPSFSDQCPAGTL